jgi:hypothetical protein
MDGDVLRSQNRRSHLEVKLGREIVEDDEGILTLQLEETVIISSSGPG